MPLPVVPDVAQVRLEGRIDGQLTLNNLYFEVSGGGITPVNIATLANAVAAWFLDELTPELSQDWSAVRVQAFDLGDPAGAAATATSAGPGGVAGESAPNNVAACISIRTASRGRSGRGRNFLPGVPNSLITLNTLDNTFMATLVSVYEQLIGPGTFLAGWQQVIVSYYTAGALRVAPLVQPVVGVEFTTPYVRSMRSREIGHGA